MKVNRLTLLIAVCLGAGAAHAQAPAQAPVQSLADVRRAAEGAVRAAIDPGLTGVELETVALDPRLRLPPCGGKLGAQAPSPRPGQSRALARVTCNLGVAWSVNVPVDLRRHVDVLILKRAAARGETLGASDVTVQRRVVSGITSPFVDSVGELANRITRRPLPSGTALSADALTIAVLIHRGQSVTLASGASGIEVRAPGLAMADAAANQRIRVQNLYSLKIVEGVAGTDSVVRVGH